jgi:hypothetical protein
MIKIREPNYNNEGCGLIFVDISTATIENNFWALYIDNFGECPFFTGGAINFKDVLVWASSNTLTNNDLFTGSLDPEFNDNGELLCIEWPCGVKTACTSDH